MAGVPIKRKLGRPSKDLNSVSTSKLNNIDDGSSRDSITEVVTTILQTLITKCYCNLCSKWVYFVKESVSPGTITTVWVSVIVIQ